MVRKYSCFEEKGGSESLKLCGTCSRVTFDLSEADQTFLDELIKQHGLPLLQHWIKKGVIMVSGSGRRVDLEKTRAVKIIVENQVYCKVAKTKVFYVTGNCFAWLPRRVSSASFSVNHKGPPMDSQVESTLKRKKSITIYISTDVLERVTAEAKQQNRSRSNTIETLLTQSLTTT
jgi:hypothetical protein